MTNKDSENIWKRYILKESYEDEDPIDSFDPNEEMANAESRREQQRRRDPAYIKQQQQIDDEIINSAIEDGIENIRNNISKIINSFNVVQKLKVGYFSNPKKRREFDSFLKNVQIQISKMKNIAEKGLYKEFHYGIYKDIGDYASYEHGKLSDALGELAYIIKKSVFPLEQAFEHHDDFGEM